MARSPWASGWRIRAACRDTDPDLFFPTGTGWERERQVHAAKAVCASCPVRRECLDAAVDLGVLDGVWGGAAPDERDRLQRAVAS